MPSPSFSFDLGNRAGRSDPAASREAGAERVEPREWQRRLIQLLRARLVDADSGPGQDVLVHAGPGAGKTLGALLGFQCLRREGRLEGMLIFCHRSSIAAQWRTAARRLGLELGEWDPQRSLPDRSAGLLLSYQAASRHRPRLEEELARWGGGGDWMAIADEVHHLGVDPEEPEATAWGHAFSRLSRGARLRLGLSGTPFRADNLAFCSARRLRVEERGEICERIVPDLCVEPRRLIVAGDVRPLEFRFQDGWVEHGRETAGEERQTSPLSGEERESWRARNLRRAIRLGDGGGIALRVLLEARRRLERVRGEHPQAGGLVIGRDIGHARRIAALLREQGDAVLLVHSQDPEAAARLEAFRSGEADWLVSIDMCAEGFDAPRLRVVAYLTTVVTRSRFLQAITRAVRVDGARAAIEPVPRHPSYVVAPADPLLLAHARTWSLSEPYRIRPRPGAAATAAAGVGNARLPLRALADDPGALLRVRGPELPPFLRRPA
jgi:superfamily II DNA or RNA helicase